MTLRGWVVFGRKNSWIVPAMLVRAIRQAINNHLKTVTVKENLTV